MVSLGRCREITDALPAHNPHSRTDWMHDTARCLGYPSDSTRAARERAPGDNLHRFLSPCGSALRPCGSTLSHLVGVGSQPLAMGHGRSAWGARYRARSKPGPGVAAAAIGVQRDAGLGWQGLRVATGAPCILSHLAGVGG